VRLKWHCPIEFRTYKSLLRCCATIKCPQRLRQFPGLHYAFVAMLQDGVSVPEKSKYTGSDSLGLFDFIQSLPYSDNGRRGDLFYFFNVRLVCTFPLLTARQLSLSLFPSFQLSTLASMKERLVLAVRASTSNTTTAHGTSCECEKIRARRRPRIVFSRSGSHRRRASGSLEDQQVACAALSTQRVRDLLRFCR